MNCKDARHHLLRAEQPGRPPAAVDAHLLHCSPCRQWQDRLFQLERDVPRLPVPPSTAKAALLDRLAREPAPRGANATPLAKPPRILKLFGSPALPPATLAASLLVFAFVWWLLQGQRPTTVVADNNPAPAQAPAPDVLLKNLMDCNLRLAKADQPGERVVALADIADELQKKSQELAFPGAEDGLKTLAGLFGQVVRKGILERAETLPLKERAKVLAPLAVRLDKTEAAAIALADKVPTDAATSLRELAKTAREGSEKLKKLAADEVALRHLLLSPGVTAALTIVVQADGEDPLPLPSEEEAQRFRKNRKLVEKLVDSGLRMAAEERRLKRAECCNDLASYLMDQVRDAAKDKESYRAAELGGHLHSLLQDGVAGILDKEAELRSPLSPGVQELRGIQNQVDGVAARLKDQFDREQDPEVREQLQRTLAGVQDAQKKVQKALKRLGPEAIGGD